MIGLVVLAFALFLLGLGFIFTPAWMLFFPLLFVGLLHCLFGDMD